MALPKFKPIWERRPHRGERWRFRGATGSETRTVIDRTLGGHVIYRSGRYRHRYTVPFSEWHEWQRFARQVR